MGFRNSDDKRGTAAADRWRERFTRNQRNLREAVREITRDEAPTLTDMSVVRRENTRARSVGARRTITLILAALVVFAAGVTAGRCDYQSLGLSL